MPRVVLFKTPTTNNGTDAYEQHFTRAGFGVTYIPVLQETFHLEELTRIVLDSDAVWGGVVITSKRGAEAWAEAAQKCKDTLSSWNDIQLYTVGSSSVDYLSTIHSTLPKELRLDTARAIQAKSATALLPLILETDCTDARPLLLIRGDKSTNELQHGLQKAQREHIEAIVYSTTCRQSLEADVRMLLETVREIGEDVWLAFFSPSSAEMVLGCIRSLVGDGGIDERNEDIWSRVKIGAIGETTAQFLRDQGMEVKAIAKDPTAEGLASAIQASGCGSERGDLGV